MNDKVFNVAILLSTFNGERFLSLQIESLLKQTHTKFKIYIRDDGSSDSTIDIINTYINQYPEIIELTIGENIGSSKSFLWLLSNVDADIYFFCDQDDYWFLNKITNHISKYKDVNTLGVFSDLKINEHSTLLSLQKMKPSKLIYNALYLLCQNCVAGCSLSISKKARNFILDCGNIPEGVVHDHWFSLLIKLKGDLKYINQPQLFYRLHTGNQVGVSTFNFKYIFKVMIKIKKTINHDLLLLNSINKIKSFTILEYVKSKIYINIVRIL